ncbi:NAD(P)-dependent dehydrogenase (short-subunit alcohol dehydrogenase family) [Xanthobacter flavus]|uniref:NAD(P)-dependent dehydrogenase (Short-subunit alcohol dehydrogenase family) n=1 Tax=Xanthobacter flavus TaxID=281 RepID=A0A9W6FJ73_XANFL|nr:SDR family NAD(P)-dependent oxidoreductase [Xanthobacter flavus]MDR6331798.1 NAD(P)-dependent dehydrogenase (short-subunit alcohol dehydrogenase family) [Xanthobacter flavus]GLI22409.1 oxidoreductase [Xanthobacter flavus]
MTDETAAQTAIIVGAGKGLSASLARRLAREGFRVALVARDVDKLAPLVAETGGRAYAADAQNAPAIEGVFAEVDKAFGPPDLVVFNASMRYRGPVEVLDPADVMEAYSVGAFAGFLTAQAATRRMLARGQGSLFFTGATASVKAMPHSVPFAMAKFALRALAQGLARELGPRGIHVAHFILDGGIASSWATAGEPGPADKWLDPDAIAETYLSVHRQHRSAWTCELDLRPWVEKF